jgi:tRNA G18 (ribose-2'-O)-methylase SpoU
VVVAGAGLLEEIYANGGVEDARVVFLGEAAETPRGMRARRVVRAPEHVLKKAAGLQSVDRVDVVAELATPPLDGIEALGAVASTATRLLALDGIQDPGNLGTLTRTALALGWDAVALLPGTCDPFNDKVTARILIALSAHPVHTNSSRHADDARMTRRLSTVDCRESSFALKSESVLLLAFSSRIFLARLLSRLPAGRSRPVASRSSRFAPVQDFLPERAERARRDRAA